MWVFFAIEARDNVSVKEVYFKLMPQELRAGLIAVGHMVGLFVVIV